MKNVYPRVCAGTSITVVGNRDTVLGQTAGITIQQRYHNTEEVVCHEPERRLEPATCELCC